MTPKPRSRFGPILALAFVLWPAVASAGDGPCPRLRLVTDIGSLDIELYPDAAPAATGRLLALAGGGQLGEVRLETVRPHSLVATGDIPEFVSEPVPMEIDARHLGLDRQRIASVGEAMDVLQGEVLPIHVENKRSAPTDTFGRWIETWRASRTAEFLVGTSRQELYEAFGHLYRDGLASRPVVRGSVLMRPASSEHAEPRLVFSLGERPQKTGRWMVIGQVIGGLEHLRRLSVAPLENDFAKAGRLARPVAVRSMEITDSAPGIGSGALAAAD